MNIDKVIKWFMPKEERFHGLLEEACDRCKDFTHVVGNVAIKNA